MDVALAIQKVANLYFDMAGIFRQDFIDGKCILVDSGLPYLDQRYEGCAFIR
jgi:hypothetical protein